MRPRRHHPCAAGHRAFTLVEVLIATVIFATILAAIETAFYGALRLRSSTTRMTDATVPINHLVSVLRADLRGLMVPVGLMISPMVGLNLGVGSSALEFCTTTGVIDTQQYSTDFPGQPPATSQLQSSAYVQGLPWGDVQRIDYYLTNSLMFNRSASGKQLVRAVTRNLLAAAEPDVQFQALVGGVQTFTVLYYDGLEWVDVWDGTNAPAPVPVAVKVQIEFAPTNRYDAPPAPVELVVPLMMQPSTNTTAAASGGGGQTSTGGSGGGQNSTSGRGGGNSSPSGGGGSTRGRG